MAAAKSMIPDETAPKKKHKASDKEMQTDALLSALRKGKTFF